MKTGIFSKIATSLILGMLSPFIIASCSSDDDGNGNNPRKKIELTPEEAVIASDGQSMALNMLKYFAVNSENDNFMVSPLSAQFCLGMLANGASGNTLKEFVTELNVTSLSELNSLNQRLSTELPKVDKKTAFRNANSMWLNKDFQVLPDYSLILSKVYNADATSLDLTTMSAVNKINRWCSDKTNGMISKIFSEPLSDQVDMLLINALYFKGEWSEPFEKGNTSDKEFTNADGSKVKVPMMQDSQTIRCLRSTDHYMFSLNYGNEAYRMIVILPYEGYNLGGVLESFSMDDWAKWKREGQVMECSLWMPKFKIDTDLRLNDFLLYLGIKDAFNPTNADFSNLSQKNVLLSDVWQLTSIEVDEKGTEAAAVTIGGIMDSLPIGPDMEIHVDRPFAFLIEETSTGAVLFAGRINKM